jgi:hypothetical protein
MRGTLAWGAISRAALAAALTTFLSVGSATAATLRVGPGQTYATPCAAIAAAKARDEIEIAAGTYSDSCAIAVAGLTLRGVGGQPKVDLSSTDHPAQYKGIYVVTADDVTIENLELMGAHIDAAHGLNAAAIRVEAKGLTVRRCKIHDNQNGILGGTSGTITIEHSEFFGNGLGDGCNEGGCTHNLYIANIDTLYFRFNWSHSIATDTRDKGHLLKSRAKNNYIEYNRFTGEQGHDSYEVELPNGGLAVVVGNVIQKGRAAGNPTLLSWGAEGASNPDKRLFLSNNTFVNDFGSGTFIAAPGATLRANNNLFVGAGTVVSGGPLSADNLSGVDPLFVARAAHDYHLSSGSPAIGKGVAPAAVDALPLAAVSEYVHPLGKAARPSARDVGAFEYGTTQQPAADGGAATADSGVAGATGDAGLPRPSSDGGATDASGARPGAPVDATSDGGASSATDAGASSAADASGSSATDAGVNGATRRSADAGCSLAATRNAAARGWWLLCTAALACWRSRQRRRPLHPS